MVNVGNPDRIVRAALGLAIIAIALIAGWPTLGLVAGIVVGLVLIATSVFSFCPIYALLGLSSKRRG